MAFHSEADPVLRRWEPMWRQLSPPQLFVGSFLVLVLLGTLGLKALPGLYTGEELSWLDALFTATSAACVTGLIVVDTATYFTTAGQAVVLLLIQLGGLGMLAFTSLIIVALGRRLSLRHGAFATDVLEVVPRVEPRHLIRDIVLFTFAIEAAGAALLYGLWRGELGGDALWAAVFHAISAFCNAGFSTFSDSLIGAQRDGGVLAVVMALIVLGGIGFLTLEEFYLWRRSIREKRRFRLSLHSRLVLVTTAALLLLGWPLFVAFEWEGAFGGLPIGAKLVNGLFASVTARTAGFNAIDYGAATDSTNFLTILLMFVGGSPGSTAGGLKTTTLALVVLLAWSRMRGYEVVSAWGRSVPEETVQRAVGLFVVATLVITAGTFVFTTSEIGTAAHPHGSGGFLRFTFEAFSAFNTVGLSMGVTPDLSALGKWTAILLMFLGRVGPLTFAAALARQRRGDGFRFAYEDVIVG